MIRSFAPRAFTRLNHVSNASNSGLLFVAENCSLITCFNISLSGDMSTTSAPFTFFRGRPICLDCPCLHGEFFFLVEVGELCDEVCQYLGFDCCSRPIFDVELAQFNCLLDESSCCIYLVHRLSYWLVYHDDDGVCLEVRMEFLRSDHQCKSYLFHP